MEIVVGKLAGFCAGVKNTVNQAEEILKENENVYCLGEIIHNSKVIEELENKGMVTINNIEEALDGSIVIFRAHGEPIEVYKRAEEKNLKIMDLICPRVKIIHDKVQKYKDKAFIIIVGKPLHPEVIATKSFAGENCYIIETEDDILDAYMEYEKTSFRTCLYSISNNFFKSKI